MPSLVADGIRRGPGRPPLPGALRLEREPGVRCDFCGATAEAVAVVASQSRQLVAICSSCLGRAASDLGRTDGGDAA